MDPNIKLLIFAAVAVLAILAIALVVARRRRSDKLRLRFGPEYERTVREHGPGRGESLLVEREKRVESFPIRDLTPEEHQHFVADWHEVQARFVDDPRGAVSDADLLVVRLMQTRGYPMSDFEQRAADLSVTHPRVVENYRSAREVALRDRKGEANTEDLRNAVRYYRSLFDELLETTPGGRREVA